MSEQHDSHDAHTGPITSPKQLVWASIAAFVIPVFVIIGLVYYVTSANKEAPGASDAERAVAERIQKVGVVEVRDANRPLKSGEEVYKAQCAACHAAGAAGVVAPRDKSAPLNEVAARVSAGASDHLPYLQVTNLARAIDELQQADYRVIGLAGEAQASLYKTDLTGRIALVFGAEGDGMRRLTRERCDELVRLPMQGSVESLNVSVACGVVCYEALRQRSRA